MFSKAFFFRVVKSRDRVVKWLTFPKQILDPSKLKELEDYNFLYDKNSGKFSKRVENTVGKGEIARCSFQAISPFPTVFSKYLYCRHVKTQDLFGKGSRQVIHFITQ